MPEKTTQNEPVVNEDDLLKSLDTLEKLAKGDPGSAPAEDLKKAETLPEGEELKKSADEPGPAGEELKKADPPDPDDKDEDDKDEDDDAEKSFASKAADASEEVSKAIEVSEFLGELVGQIGEFLDGLKKSVDERIGALEKNVEGLKAQNQELAGALSKSIVAIQGEIQKSVKGAEDLSKSLESFAARPAHGRKAVTTTVLEKSFDGNADGGDGGEKLTKGEVLGRMTDMIMKSVNGVTAVDLVRFEGSGEMTPHVAELVRNYKR